MVPSFSSMSRRREQAEGDRPTLTARSELVIRAFCWSARKIARSMASRFAISVSFEFFPSGAIIFELSLLRNSSLQGHCIGGVVQTHSTIRETDEFGGMHMRVGCPKEIKNHEYRVGLTPAAVREYVAHGHEVWVETKAGAGIGADHNA